MILPGRDLLRIGDWRVDPAIDEISKDGTAVKLEPRTMRLLVYLAQHVGEIVSVDQVLNHVWKDLIVTPNSVYNAVAVLRRVLGDDPKNPTYIDNILRRGYRLVASVAPWSETPPADFEPSATPVALPRKADRLSASVQRGTGPVQTSQAHTAARKPVLSLRAWIIAGASVVLALVASYFYVDRAQLIKHETTGASVVDKSIAVLPFTDMSEKRDQGYFADGMSEELIDLLAQVPTLHVPARTSSFYFKGKQASLHDIAVSLGVSHVLEGSVRTSGNTIRVTTQLIRVDTGFHVWSQSYDRPLGDIFKVQDEISHSVITALKASLLDKPLVSVDAATNSETYNIYLQARAMYQRRTEGDNALALIYLRRAVQLDPSYAPAWASIADILVDDYKYFAAGSYKEARNEAYLAADHALAINPQLAVAHLAKARLLYEMDWDFDAADTEISSVLGSTPRNSQALRLGSELASTRGQFARALDLAQQSVANDPLDSRGFARIAGAEVAEGNLADAIGWFRKALELNPTGSVIHYQIASILVSQGDATRALQEAKLEPDASLREASLALAYDGLGLRKEADEALNLITTNYSTRAAYQIVEILSSRGDLSGSFTWLERAYQQHDTGLLKMNCNPLLKSLRDDSRFKDFVRRTRLPV